MVDAAREKMMTDVNLVHVPYRATPTCWHFSTEILVHEGAEFLRTDIGVFSAR
jgi:hypothetical protein